MERTAAETDATPPLADSVDALLASWQRVRPDLDFAPVGVVTRLARARAHIDRELDALFAAHGLTAPSFAVLATLARLDAPDGVSQRRLMDELGLTSGTVSVRMDRLEADGLVTRETDPADRRNSRIRLTAGGRALVERVVPAHVANEARLLAGLDPVEQQQLAGLLRRLLVEFEGSAPASAPPLLGVALAPAHVAARLRAELGLAEAPGLLVRAVEEGAPADGRLRPGDVLAAADGRPLRSASALHAALADAAPRGSIVLAVVRGAERVEVSVPVGAPPPATAPPAGRAATERHLI